uniref:Uncharacterized protein n=1 Tax=Setaria viridis TaxID=4556 RepID=A0A4U6TQ19_SETVI|nr:hypothetical protein SEVIR_7G023310v2 [Setaria viridis]
MQCRPRGCARRRRRNPQRFASGDRATSCRRGSGAHLSSTWRSCGDRDGRRGSEHDGVDWARRVAVRAAFRHTGGVGKATSGSGTCVEGRRSGRRSCRSAGWRGGGSFTGA